jgi:hypothetical protein
MHIVIILPALAKYGAWWVNVQVKRAFHWFEAL